MLAPAKYLSFERYFESTLESTRKHSTKHSLESTLQRFFTDAVTQRYSIKNCWLVPLLKMRLHCPL